MPLFRSWWLAILFILFISKTSAQQGFGYHSNPQAYWYFLTPTGYGPLPKKAILQNGMIAASQYQKTTRNGNTTSLGLIPTLLFGGDYMPIWVSGHWRLPIGGSKRQPAMVANAGGFFLALPSSGTESDNPDFSLLYFNCTFGSREKNFAIGAAIAPTGFGDNIHPQAITLHGLTRLGRRSCLVTENYLIHDRGAWIPFSMAGWRRWRGATAFDIGLMLTRIPAGSSASQKRLWLPMPWLAVHKTLRFDMFNPGEE